MPVSTDPTYGYTKQATQYVVRGREGADYGRAEARRLRRPDRNRRQGHTEAEAERGVPSVRHSWAHATRNWRTGLYKMNSGGLLLPCDVCVWEDDERGATVAIARPDAMFEVVKNPALEPIVREADQRLRRALDTIT